MTNFKDGWYSVWYERYRGAQKLFFTGLKHTGQDVQCKTRRGCTNQTCTLFSKYTTGTEMRDSWRFCVKPRSLGCIMWNTFDFKLVRFTLIKRYRREIASHSEFYVYHGNISLLIKHIHEQGCTPELVLTRCNWRKTSKDFKSKRGCYLPCHGFNSNVASWHEFWKRTCDLSVAINVSTKYLKVT